MNVQSASADLLHSSGSLDHFVYLNNATTSYPKCESALGAFQRTISAPPSDVRHSDAPAIEIARGIIAEVLEISPEFVFFAPDATLALNMIIRGALPKGGRAVVDNRAHNATTRTLHNSDGIDWRVVDFYDVDDAIKDKLPDAVDPSVDLVCLTHTSNVTGSVFDLRSSVNLARRWYPNAQVVVDASQSAGVTSLNDLVLADFAVFPGHKHLHSVPGAAVAIAKTRLAPVLFGGTGTKSSLLSMDAYTANIVEVGTPNVPAIMAMAMALADWKQNAAVYHAHVAGMVQRLWQGLSRIEGIVMLGRPPGAARTGIVALSPARGLPEQEWVRYLREQGVVVRGGLHCSPLHHVQLGLAEQGSLRFSVSRFTTAHDVDVAIRAMEQFAHTLMVLDE